MSAMDPPIPPVNNVHFWSDEAMLVDSEVEGTPVVPSDAEPSSAIPYAFLGRHRVFVCGEHVPFEPNSIVQVSSNDTIFEAFVKLVRFNVLSAPIWDEGKSSYNALVDMADLVHLAVDVFDNSTLTSLSSLKASATDTVFGQGVLDVSDRSKYNPFVPVPNGIDLLTVVRLLGERGLRRVCVVDEDELVQGVISQSRVIRWIAENMDSLGPCIDQTLEELALVAGADLVVSIKDNQLACEAFKLMRDCGVTSVAIVDHDSGALITVLSVRDLKALCRVNPETDEVIFDFSLLFQSVMDLVAFSRQMSLGTTAPAVSVAPTATLRDVIGKLAATRMHRLFVTDAARRPVGCVSLGDILRSIPTRIA